MLHFEFHPLDKTFDRTLFDCGVEELNQFLKTKSRQNQKVGFNQTFVAIRQQDATKQILGFYSLSMGEVSLQSLPPEVAKKLPKHPVPLARMGRLATDLSARGYGLGKLLLVDAMKRIQTASKSIGVYALMVEAKDKQAMDFYLKYGFIPLTDHSLSLFLPLASFPQ